MISMNFMTMTIFVFVAYSICLFTIIFFGVYLIYNIVLVSSVLSLDSFYI